MGTVVQIVNIILPYFPWILAAVAVYMVIRHAEQWLEGRSGVIIAALGIAVAVAAITVFRPQIFSFFLGSRRQVEVARAEVYTYALDPMDNPDTWISGPAHAAAVAVQSEYELLTARNQAAMAAAEAARASHLPPKHPDRDAWDDEGIDPAVRALPPAVQAGAKVLPDVEKYLSQPLGTPPPEAQYWLQSIYRLPRGVASLAAMTGLMVVMGLSFRLIR